MDNQDIYLGKVLSVRKGDIETQNRTDARKVFDVVSGDIALEVAKKILDGLDSKAGSDENFQARDLLKTFKDKIFKTVTPDKLLPKDESELDLETAVYLDKLMSSYKKKHGITIDVDSKDYEVVDDLGI